MQSNGPVGTSVFSGSSPARKPRSKNPSFMNSPCFPICCLLSYKGLRKRLLT
jgi:hypothetical protein